MRSFINRRFWFRSLAMALMTCLCLVGVTFQMPHVHAAVTPNHFTETFPSASYTFTQATPWYNDPTNHRIGTGDWQVTENGQLLGTIYAFDYAWPDGRSGIDFYALNGFLPNFGSGGQKFPVLPAVATPPGTYAMPIPESVFGDRVSSVFNTSNHQFVEYIATDHALGNREFKLQTGSPTASGFIQGASNQITGYEQLLDSLHGRQTLVVTVPVALFVTGIVTSVAGPLLSYFCGNAQCLGRSQRFWAMMGGLLSIIGGVTTGFSGYFYGAATAGQRAFALAERGYILSEEAARAGIATNERLSRLEQGLAQWLELATIH